MMIEQKRKAAKLMFSAVAAAASAWSAAPTHAATLAQWSFTSTQPQPPVTIVGGTTTTNPNASPNTQAPTFGSGLASQLGMMNSYTYAGGEGPAPRRDATLWQPPAPPIRVSPKTLGGFAAFPTPAAEARLSQWLEQLRSELHSGRRVRHAHGRL